MLLILLLSAVSLGFCEDVNIGALFENDDNLENALNFAIDYVNHKDDDRELTFYPIIQNVTTRNPYMVMKNACFILEEGVVAIFGPRSMQNIAVVQSTCDNKEIPHIVTRWNYWSTRDEIMINMYPNPSLLSSAYYQIISAKKWETFTVLYEDNESLLRIKNLVEDAQYDGVSIQLMQLDQIGSGNFRPTIKQLKLTGQTCIVIDCHIDTLFEVLTQLQQAGLMSDSYSYFLTNLDAHTGNLAPFKYSNADIIGIRLINPEDEYVQKVAADYFSDDVDSPDESSWKLKLETALIIDSMDMFKNVFVERQRSSSIQIVRNNNILSCSEVNSWEHGFSIVNMYKSYPYEGLTGQIYFDNEGFRSNFELTVYELLEEGITDVGIWNSTSGLNMSISQDASERDDPESLRNKMFIVQITLTEPYGMLRLTTEHVAGNDMFEGYAVDLIAKLAEMEGFNYTFIVRDDKSSGSFNKATGKWSGMIGDLLDHVADLAICDFTITAEREEVVDFTDPFMSLGIGILFRKPETAPPSFFSFADPFGLDTWICLGVSFFVVACALYFTGRLCADEWTNPLPCIEEPEYLVNQFSFANAIWFTTGAVLAQGSEIAPIAMSTRMCACFWWYFCLIMNASYTANLAAFLATENPIKLFTDLESLYGNEHKVTYGAKLGGATLRYFQSAEEGTLLRKVGQHMSDHPEDLVKENDEGVIRADNEKYAFFMESSSIEYSMQRYCNLQKYGDNLDHKGYGIAMRKGSSYRKRLSLAILKLQQNHFLEDLKKKWWEERRGGGSCEGNEEPDEAEPMGMQNVEGCFYCTIYGTILAVITVIIEHLIHLIRVRRKSKMPFIDVCKKEFKAYVDFQNSSKANLMIEATTKSEENEKEVTINGIDIKRKSSQPKSRSQSRSIRSRSCSISRARLRQNRKSILKTNSSTPLAYGFIFRESVETLKP